MAPDCKLAIRQHGAHIGKNQQGQNRDDAGNAQRIYDGWSIAVFGRMLRFRGGANQLSINYFEISNLSSAREKIVFKQIPGGSDGKYNRRSFRVGDGKRHYLEFVCPSRKRLPDEFMETD